MTIAKNVEIGTEYVLIAKNGQLISLPRVEAKRIRGTIETIGVRNLLEIFQRIAHNFSLNQR